ncbi:hypothetical protein BGZ76_006992, partial [Entomortierella beljakovae]
DEKIRTATGNFYRHEGPVEIVRFWGTDSRYSSENFISTLADFVIPKAANEIQNLASNMSLHFPASSITKEVVANFELRKIAGKIQSDAPLVRNIIYGLSSINSNHVNKRNIVFTTICSMLLYLANQQSNYLQAMIGLFLFSSGCSTDTMDAIPAADLTWEVCEQTFIQELKTPRQRGQEVLEAVKVGMKLRESYKEYAWRLERMNRIYKITGSASEEQVMDQLELSVPSIVLTQMNIQHSGERSRITKEWTY